MSKRTWIIALGCLLIYKIRNFPNEINTSDFIQLINSPTFIIKELKNLNNKLVLFSRPDNSQFVCHYPVTNLDSFNSILMKKRINFDYLSGLKAFSVNPYNQIFYMAGIFGMISSQVVSQEVMKLRKYWNKKKLEKVSDEEIFKELIVNDQVKRHIKVIVDQLKDPTKYEDKKIKLIKGCLVYGTPGCGKTLLAKCLSKIEGITFINTCASEFVEIYVGTGPKKVREIFKVARENRPAIIFIDELESIGASRSSDINTYTHNTERYSTLNQLLAEMDGVVNNDNIVVIAATNREDLLDAALVRPGRFDYKINLSLPDKNLRQNIFKLYLSKYDYDKNEINDNFIDILATKSENVSGAIIESICNDAATNAFSNSRNDIWKIDLIQAYDRNLEEFRKFKAYEIKNTQKFTFN